LIQIVAGDQFVENSAFVLPVPIDRAMEQVVEETQSLADQE